MQKGILNCSGDFSASYLERIELAILLELDYQMNVPTPFDFI